MNNSETRQVRFSAAGAPNEQTDRTKTTAPLLPPRHQMTLNDFCTYARRIEGSAAWGFRRSFIDETSAIVADTIRDLNRRGFRLKEDVHGLEKNWGFIMDAICNIAMLPETKWGEPTKDGYVHRRMSRIFNEAGILINEGENGRETCGEDFVSIGEYGYQKLIENLRTLREAIERVKRNFDTSRSWRWNLWEYDGYLSDLKSKVGDDNMSVDERVELLPGSGDKTFAERIFESGLDTKGILSQKGIYSVYDYKHRGQLRNFVLSPESHHESLRKFLHPAPNNPYI